jgi:hypothetical protein
VLVHCSYFRLILLLLSLLCVADTLHATQPLRSFSIAGFTLLVSAIHRPCWTVYGYFIMSTSPLLLSARSVRVWVQSSPSNSLNPRQSTLNRVNGGVRRYFHKSAGPSVSPSRNTNFFSKRNNVSSILASTMTAGIQIVRYIRCLVHISHFYRFFGLGFCVGAFVVIPPAIYQAFVGRVIGVRMNDCV